MEEAVTSWFTIVYVPIISTIKTKKILKKFPKRTYSDLYVWVVRYWDDLKRKFGNNDISIDLAVEDFTKKYKIPIYKRFINTFKRIVLRKAIDSLNDSSINTVFN